MEHPLFYYTDDHPIEDECHFKQFTHHPWEATVQAEADAVLNNVAIGHVHVLGSRSW
jgi:hypothetical protein